MHNPPEKVDEFFRRFEACVLSGHHVFRSPYETGWPRFRGVAKLNDEDEIR